MKLLVVLVALVAVCASSVISPDFFKSNEVDYEAIPKIPGDNSHYIEGKSRYIWMQDGDGVDQLIDLHESVNESALSRTGRLNHYWLFTRQNPTNPQVLINGIPHIIWETNFDRTRPIIVLVHGYMSSGSSEFNTLITSALLAVLNANVIVVDWSSVAYDMNYNTVVAAVPSVGQAIGSFLVWLINTTGSTWTTVHLVGHGVGAHIVGSAGQQAGRRPSRVTGLDPAGPGFKGNSTLTSTAGTYVEGIHTDGDLLGIYNRVGNADFYPNGGRHPQPECRFSSCSHDRAYELFASSVRTNTFAGRGCATMNNLLLNTCTGVVRQMGNSIVSKSISGIFRLTTRGVWPF